ncbi:MAG: hypothetical protein ACREOJ_07225 [Gemmatimonadaceae bacterium]
MRHNRTHSISLLTLRPDKTAGLIPGSACTIRIELEDDSDDDTDVMLTQGRPFLARFFRMLIERRCICRIDLATPDLDRAHWPLLIRQPNEVRDALAAIPLQRASVVGVYPIEIWIFNRDIEPTAVESINAFVLRSWSTELWRAAAAAGAACATLVGSTVHLSFECSEFDSYLRDVQASAKEMGFRVKYI